jgi:phosphoserine aminotransferase
MSWQHGTMLICAALIAAYLAAELLAWLNARFGSGWIRKLHRLERARISWQAKCIQEQAFYKQDVQP